VYITFVGLPVPSTRRSDVRAAVLLLAGLLCWAAPARAQQQGGQEGGDEVNLASEIVLVPVSVRHAKGGPVTDMRSDELALSDDGAPQQIAFFNLDTAPVDVVLLVDSSGSIEGLLSVVQAAAFSFLKQLRPEDRFSIVTFSERPVIRLDWSGDLKAAASALREIQPEGSTAFYGSVVAVTYERFESREAGRRRAVVVLTDGDDTISSVTSRTAARAALAHDVAVYVVSIGRIAAGIYEQVASNRTVPTEKRQEFRDALGRLRRAEERMTYLVDQTGGRIVYPSGPGDLTKAYREIAEEIRSRYLLGYYPPPNAAAGFHAITVGTQRKNVRVHARQGYFKE
jgi:Ca-activated chloride channel family protein